MNAATDKENEIIKKKTLKNKWKIKIKNIENSLEKGEDINAADDKRNTQLHTAVLNAEVDVVKYLLDKKADITIKNSDGLTAIDMVKLYSDNKHIESLLRKYQDGNYSSNKQIKNKPRATRLPKALQFEKRAGTTALRGQLYETKLLSLILFRALHDSKIEEFYLATNVVGLGAFDDIVFRYKKQGEDNNSKLMFVQAKHKDDPEKGKITDEYTLKNAVEFSLHNYLDSFMEVLQKFCSNSKYELFKGPLNNINCEFIIYTPAMENFDKQVVIQQTEEESYIKTSQSGKIFQFRENDRVIEQLTPTVKNILCKQIAKRLSNFINQKTAIMMTDNLIKAYHVFLEQNIIELQDQDKKSNNPYIEVLFRQSFLETKDEHLLLIKYTICKNLNIFKGKDAEMQAEEYSEKLKSLTFKVQENFGNVKFLEKMNQETLKHLYTTLSKLFIGALIQDCYYNYYLNVFIHLRTLGSWYYMPITSHCSAKISLPCFHFARSYYNVGQFLKNESPASRYYIIEIKESDIDPEKKLQHTDMEVEKLGGLVGNLLIFDQETQMLKFDLNADHLSGYGSELLYRLKKENHNLNDFRFDVKIPWFPKLVLSKETDDENLVRDFLKQLKFYTNQSQEDEVENILKQIIDVNCKLKHSDAIFRAKTDAIYLKFHDDVQTWWKQSGLLDCLTKTCQFYHEAERNTLDSPLLRILNYTCRNKMKSYGIKFKPYAIEAFKVTDIFKNESAKVMVFVSNEIIFTSIKYIQYQSTDNDHIVLNLEYVLGESYLEHVKEELNNTEASVLVLIYQTFQEFVTFQEAFEAVKKAFQGKIILITNANVSHSLKYTITDGIILQTDQCSFTDLEEQSQEMILKKRKFVFQGQEVSVNEVLNTEFLREVTPNIIVKFINHEKIVVGRILTDNLYKKTVKFYINQSICRYVTLHNKENTDLYFIKDPVLENAKPQDYGDIIIITESSNYYENVCDEYSNVHWFKREISGSDNLKLIKSKDGFNIKDKVKGLKVTYQVMPKTVKDVEDKMVIISGESGMGKSTFISHLAVYTKQKYPKMWVSKINFQEHFLQFKKWKSDQTNIDSVEVLKFLYGTVVEGKTNILEVIGNSIVLNNDNEVHLNTLNIDVEETDLFEISVFNHCYNNNRVVLLFDGFDELCPDYADEMIQLLSTLKSSKVAHIWVTTRPYNVVNQLHDALGTCSFKIMPFNNSDKIRYLKEVWTAKKFDENERCDICLDVIFFKYYLTRAVGDGSFLDFPLHIYLIANLYENSFRELSIYLEMSLWTTYEKFIKKNYFTPYEETFTNSSIGYRLEIESNDNYKVFLRNFKKISAHTLFNKKIVEEWFSYEDFEDIQDLKKKIQEGIEKSGIIECIIGSRPKFVHSTYADYFATGYICDKLKSGYCTSSFWEYLLTDIFVTDDKMGIRRFMDSKLGEEEYLLNITKLYESYSHTILEILLSQPQSRLTTLEASIEEHCDNIAKFILQLVRSAIHKDNLDSFIKLLTKKTDYWCLFCCARIEMRDTFLWDVCELILNINPAKIEMECIAKVLRYLYEMDDDSEEDSTKSIHSHESEDEDSEDNENEYDDKKASNLDDLTRITSFIE